MISTRKIEALTALYAAAVGILFLVFEASLSAAVYEPWLAFGRERWGVVLIAVAALHLASMWINGKAPRYSYIVRSCAGTVHLTVSFKFFTFFWESAAYWGCVTFGLLIPALVVISMTPVITMAKAQFREQLQ